MPRYSLNKWRHPKTEQVRIYLNGLETTEAKVWFDRGERQGTALPPTYTAKLYTDGQMTEDLQEEVREALLGMDLFLDKVDWTRLQRAASW